MKNTFTLIALISLAFSCPVSAQPKEEQALLEGRTLAAELSAMGPIKDSSMTGTLFIKRNKKETPVPIVMKLIKGDDSWKSIYQTKTTNTTEAAVLTIQQAAAKLNGYELLTGTNQAAQKLSGAAADIAFAGSDFWLSDLGMEFFRWPDQRVIKHELRRGQACFVLESKNTKAASGTYSKVVSWIDQDTLGIVYAEAYDTAGKHLKTFLPKTFQKVNGHYQVKDVEMRNIQTGSRTRLEFDVQTE
jgi:hypothetical protein